VNITQIKSLSLQKTLLIQDKALFNLREDKRICLNLSVLIPFPNVVVNLSLLIRNLVSQSSQVKVSQHAKSSRQSKISLLENNSHLKCCT